MPEINRSLLVVKPKQPFLDWANSLEEEEEDDDVEFTLDDVREDSTAYLIPEIESDDDQTAFLEHHHDAIFKIELASWYTDQADWPAQRDLETFLEWFDVEFHSIVIDLGSTPIEEIDNYPAEDDISSNGH